MSRQLDFEKLSENNKDFIKKSQYDIIKRLIKVSSKELKNISIGIAALALNSVTNLSFPWIMGQAVDRVFSENSQNELNFFLTTACILLTGSLASWIRVYHLGIATENIMDKLKLELFNSFVDKKINLENDINLGDYLYSIDKDSLEASKVLTDTLAFGLRSLNSSINGSILLYMSSPKLSLVSLSIVPLVGYSAMKMSKRAKKYAEQSKALESNVTSYTIERLSKLSTIKLNNKENYEKNNYYNFINQLIKLSKDKNSSQSSFMAFINLTTNISLFAVLYIGGGMIKKGEISTGDLTKFAIQSGFVGLGFSGLSSFFSDSRKGIAAANRIFDTIDQNSYRKQHSYLNTSVSEITTLPCYAKGEVTLKNVSFYYSSRSHQYILNDLSIHIPFGKIVSFVGRSGSGKSTLISILCGFIKPISGHVLLNGIEINENEYSLKDLGIGVVEQNANLLSGSIEFNISYGKDNPSKNEIIDASKLSFAHEFITEFPDGYETITGENGRSLSGGQQMKIALARAIINKPNILILDEMTAPLDEKSEIEVSKVLQSLKSSMTIILVTHSREIMSISDDIYFLKNGNITKINDLNNFYL